jgi:hypothetical protein
MYLGSITAYDTGLGTEEVARHRNYLQRLRGGAVAKKDTHCSDVEHQFGFDQKKRMWTCKNCPEAILEAQMDSIVERPVRTDSGHQMYIWPAQVKRERKGV